jgi:hypothetical protein
MLLKYLIVVQLAEEQEVILEVSVFVEYVLEKKLMLENYQVLENQVGNN